MLLFVSTLDIGGCERDVTKIAAGLDRQRFEPHVACFRAGGCRHEELVAGGVPVASFAVRSFRSLSAVRAAAAFARYLSRNGIRLVHTFDGPSTIFAVPVARFVKTPAVVASNLWYRDMVSPVYRYAQRFMDHFVDRIHVNCRAVAEHLQSDERIPGSLIYLCYNGVDTSVFCPDTASRRPERAPLTIGAVAVLRPEKGLDLILDAFARVCGRREGMKLLIVGSGEVGPALQERSRALGIEGQCRFEAARQDVTDLMRSIDIFVLPSHSESLPNALLEAMACGCCVVASSVGGIPEVIRHGQLGMLFERGNVGDLASKLTVLIDNPSVREGMAVAGSEHVRKHFTTLRVISEIERLYTSMLAER